MFEEAVRLRAARLRRDRIWMVGSVRIDVDLSLLEGFGEEEIFVDELLRH